MISQNLRGSSYKEVYLLQIYTETSAESKLAWFNSLDTLNFIEHSLLKEYVIVSMTIISMGTLLGHINLVNYIP